MGGLPGRDWQSGSGPAADPAPTPPYAVPRPSALVVLSPLVDLSPQSLPY